MVSVLMIFVLGDFGFHKFLTLVDEAGRSGLKGDKAGAMRWKHLFRLRLCLTCPFRKVKK